MKKTYNKKTGLLVLCLNLLLLSASAQQTQNITNSGDELMDWFLDAKFGMFVHFQARNVSEFNPVDFDKSSSETEMQQIINI